MLSGAKVPDVIHFSRPDYKIIGVFPFYKLVFQIKKK